MSSIIYLDHEIVQLPDTVGYWVTIKVHYGYLRKCLLGWHESRLRFVTPYDGEVSLGPLGNASHNELNVTKELATGSCVMERVKRLAGNKIERSIGIPTIESRASNMPIDKGNCIRD